MALGFAVEAARGGPSTAACGEAKCNLLPELGLALSRRSRFGACTVRFTGSPAVLLSPVAAAFPALRLSVFVLGERVPGTSALVTGTFGGAFITGIEGCVVEAAEGTIDRRTASA